MSRGASYLWGAYSNGPGVYDRERLMRLVGRQYGEPTDRFPGTHAHTHETTCCARPRPCMCMDMHMHMYR